MSIARTLIGFGHVWHRRLRPTANDFRYRSYFLLLPMRTLRHTPDATLARNRAAVLSFHDRDHGDGRDDALAWLDELLAAEGIHDAQGEVWLHTYPRVFGYVFKPVSFWYAHRADGSLAAVVAEVNNTFGERHCYLLAGPGLAWGRECHARKVFHVSPFCAIEGGYRFRFHLAGLGGDTPQHTIACIDHDDAQGVLLKTRVSGALEPFTARSRRRALWSMPFMTVGVVALIHWQALRLWAKRVPFHRQPEAPDHFVTR